MSEVRDRRRVRPRDGDAARPTRTREREAGSRNGTRQESKKESLMEKVLRTRKHLDDQRGNYYTPKEGQNRVRIMPSWRGFEEEFYIMVPTHRNIGPNNKWATCLAFWGDPCPVCRAIEQLTASESARDQNAASKMIVEERYLVNAGYPNERDGVVKPWAISRNWFSEILGYFGDPEYGDFTNPHEGYDYLFTRRGQGLKTKYENKHFARRPTPIKIHKAKSKLINLDLFPRRHTRSELRAFLRGEDE